MTRPSWKSAQGKLRGRDQFVVLVSLASLVAMAWGYLAVMARSMGDMPAEPGIHRWAELDFLAMFVMWSVMMVGMMVPTAMRAVLIYAGMVRKASAQGQTLAPTGGFVAGYIAVWTAFSLGATVVQGGLEHMALLSSMLVSTSAWLGAGLLIGAGFYQLTPWKDTCLRHCQSPAMYLATHLAPAAPSAFGLGVKHGGYCLGCCWVLMGLLFVGGVMNLLWIVAITGFVLLEKLLPPVLGTTRLTGVAMIAAGACYWIVG
jgi:predicted metal-binding membrane protein